MSDCVRYIYRGNKFLKVIIDFFSFTNKLFCVGYLYESTDNFDLNFNTVGLKNYENFCCLATYFGLWVNYTIKKSLQKSFFHFLLSQNISIENSKTKFNHKIFPVFMFA